MIIEHSKPNNCFETYSLHFSTSLYDPDPVYQVSMPCHANIHSNPSRSLQTHVEKSTKHECKSIPSSTKPLLLLNGILNSSQKRLRVRAYDLSGLLAVLEDQEGGHGADAEFLRDVRDVVDIELDEVCGGELVGEPGESGRVSCLVFNEDGGSDGDGDEEGSTHFTT